MFNFTVNNNQKVHPSGTKKAYEYNTLREADHMASICYTQYDICYTGKFETIYNIRSTIGKIIKLLNDKEDIKAIDKIFVYDNKIFMMAEGERIQLGQLKQLKNSEYVFIF